MLVEGPKPLLPHHFPHLPLLLPPPPLLPPAYLLPLPPLLYGCPRPLLLLVIVIVDVVAAHRVATGPVQSSRIHSHLVKLIFLLKKFRKLTCKFPQKKSRGSCALGTHTPPILAFVIRSSSPRTSSAGAFYSQRMASGLPRPSWSMGASFFCSTEPDSAQWTASANYPGARLSVCPRQEQNGTSPPEFSEY